MLIQRGDIFYADMPIYNTVKPNCCERGRRPCVVVSSNIGNATSRVLLVCPVTTRLKPLSCNVDIQWTKNGRQSQVLCNHIMVMPVEALTKCWGHVTYDELQAIDNAILLSLGIRTPAFSCRTTREVITHENTCEFIAENV